MPTTTPEQTFAHLRDTLLANWADYTDDIIQAVDNLAFSFDETDNLASFFEQWQDQEHMVISKQTLDPDTIYILPIKEEKLSTTPTLSEDLIWKIKM